MEWEWDPEQQDLGALGFAGICHETSRVVRRTIVPNFANLCPLLLSTLLLANTAACSVLSSLVASDGSSFRPVAYLAATFHIKIVILWLLLLYTAAYVLCIASLYGTGGDLLTADRVLKEDLPIAPLTWLAFTFLLVAFPYLVVSAVGALLWLEVGTVVPLPLWLLGWASAAYVAVVWQLACVVSVLEDATFFGVVRRSRELLVGKFGAAACVFVTLDGCFLAVLKAFPVLVMDDALGLGLGFQVAAGAAMFVALYAVVVVTLVAQPVVYMVCKRHHQEVVDTAHFD